MKALTLLIFLALALSACSPQIPEESQENLSPLLQTQDHLDISGFIADGDTELEQFPVETVEWKVSEEPLPNFHPDQVVSYYSIGDATLALVSQPNAWTALTSVREWEEAGNTAWSGILIKYPQSPWEIFFQAPEDDFNPVGFYLEEEQLVLELADDSGAGSGEGALIRYVYPFAGVVDELLYTWTKEKCEGYYIPEMYVDGTKAGTDLCSPVVN